MQSAQAGHCGHCHFDTSVLLQKKLSVATPETEGTRAADTTSTERGAADAGGSSPPAEQDPDYSTDDEDL